MSWLWESPEIVHWRRLAIARAWPYDKAVSGVSTYESNVKTFQNLLNQQFLPVLNLRLVTCMRVSWYVRNQVDESEWLYSIPQQFFGNPHLLWINVDCGLQFSFSLKNIRNLGIIRILRRLNFKDMLLICSEEDEEASGAEKMRGEGGGFKSHFISLFKDSFASVNLKFLFCKETIFDSSQYQAKQALHSVLHISELRLSNSDFKNVIRGIARVLYNGQSYSNFWSYWSV